MFSSLVQYQNDLNKVCKEDDDKQYQNGVIESDESYFENDLILIKKSHERYDTFPNEQQNKLLIVLVRKNL